MNFLCESALSTLTPRLPRILYPSAQNSVVAQAAKLRPYSPTYCPWIKIKHHFLSHSSGSTKSALLVVHARPSGALSPTFIFSLFFRLNIIISPASYDSLAFVNRIVHKIIEGLHQLRENLGRTRSSQFHHGRNHPAPCGKRSNLSSSNNPDKGNPRKALRKGFQVRLAYDGKCRLEICRLHNRTEFRPPRPRWTGGQLSESAKADTTTHRPTSIHRAEGGIITAMPGTSLPQALI